MKCSSNVWKDLLLVHISPPTQGPLLSLVTTGPASTILKKKFSYELLVLTKQTSLLSWPRFTCHFDLLSPTHLILICQTRVCFGRNRAQGHTRAWACYRLWLSRRHAFSILIWPWRWLSSCQLAYLSEDGTDKVTTSVSRECGAGRPLCIFNCHVHSSQRGHMPIEWDMAKLLISPPTHNLHVDHNGTSRFLEPQYPPSASFPLYSTHLEELKLLLGDYPPEWPSATVAGASGGFLAISVCQEFRSEQIERLLVGRWKMKGYNW